MHVLVHQEHWLLGREALELIDQHLLRALLLAVRPQVEVRVPIMRRHAEQSRYERRSLIEPVGAARQQLGSLIKSARDLMRKDKGLSTDLDRLPMLTWIMFLKFLDDMEQVEQAKAEMRGERYHPAIEPPYRWRDWAGREAGMTGRNSSPSSTRTRQSARTVNAARPVRLSARPWGRRCGTARPGPRRLRAGR